MLIIVDVQALNLLYSLTASSGTSSTPTAAFVPPPQHLALISSLIVHPSVTTRAKTPERLQASNLALGYLRLILKTIGPTNAKFHDAFVFVGAGSLSRRGVLSRKRIGEEGSPLKEDVDHVKSDLANADAIWAKADDFWHVVGWALNCSVLHKKIWAKWQVWLELMISVLEDDWEYRETESQEYSLVIRYINAGEETNTVEKRILRAVFADGSSRSLSEFGEIWKNETKERKTSNNDTTKVQKVTEDINIDENNYGDYLLSSSSELDEEEESTPLENSSSNILSNSSLSDDSLCLGGPSVLRLRLRLLSLLSTVAAAAPHQFTRLPILYDLYLTHIRPLPIPTFSYIISPLALRVFHPAAASTLTQYILRSLISSTAPLPQTDDLTQEVLQKCYLPWPANTMSVVDNVKVSLCVETLLRLLDRIVGIQWSKGLEAAMEKGILDRERKAKKEGRRKGEAGSGSVEGDRLWLKTSAERMRGILELANSN